ncbi:MAG: glycoside hydrolase family 38 N-terminal domain-containing protein [Gemmataceae bacterium]
MNARELILLSPYRIPTHNTLYLGDEEAAAFLNGYTALWHPAALAGAAAPPRLGSPYDYEQPTAGHVYAVPDNPPLVLPDDWDERVHAAGALAFRATVDRDATLDNLRQALRGWGENAEPSLSMFELEAECVAPFFGIGFGHLHVEALFEAMAHENPLASSEFWREMSAAVAALGDADPAAPRRHLQSAAERLLSAREILYPVTLHSIDMCLLDGERLADPWPWSFERGLPLNFIACSALLERLAKELPERMAALRERVSGESAEVCGGLYLEREDPLLPLESQMWNLLKGRQVHQDLLGHEVRVFARKRFGFHPQLPLLLQNVGLSRALLLAFDEGVLPSHRAPVISWPASDGKSVEAFTRAPHAADSSQTYFHLTYHLHQTIMQDQSATLALLHRPPISPPVPGGDKGRGAPWYRDWIELSRLAPVLGRWTTFSNYFNDVVSGDYASAAESDEFHGDYLVERCPVESYTYETQDTATQPGLGGEQPISMFARQARARRRLDTAWTLAALHHCLGGLQPEIEGGDFLMHLARLEDRLESQTILPENDLAEAQTLIAESLARRLTARGQANNPGFLVLNPCSFKRRVALELEGVRSLPPLTGPLKACQLDGATARVIVEVPALGFAWIPREGAPGSAPTRRMRLADERTVRNEFFEAEVDPQTGGLRALRDQRTRVSRIGQQLVFNPGSTMRVEHITATSHGPALGEVVSEGVLLDAQDQPIAHFRQRFRAWLGRPVLDLRIEITPDQPPHGYPWHAYYAARFAWRDERATLLRGVNGLSSVTSHTRPETPDYLEIRLGRQNTVLFPGGLPFHQRHGGRMIDVLLLCPGEQTHSFDLTLGLDRDHPMQTALGLVTPAPVTATTQGPPHVGAEGWLFHLDAPQLLLTSLRPVLPSPPTPLPTGERGEEIGIVARLVEVSGYGGQAELRCVRDPKRAMFLDALGTPGRDVSTQGDAVLFEVGRHDLMQLRVDFS